MDYKYKYMVETSRSGYERGEHMGDRNNYNETSHVLKHCLLSHKGEDSPKVKFGMRLRS